MEGNVVKKRYVEVDSLKGFAIFLVVLGHGIILFPINIKEMYMGCKFLYDFIYLFHMPLFFFISGFCFSYHDDYSNFIRKKIKRLLLPYCYFGVFDAIVRLCLVKYVNRPADIESIVVDFLFYGGEYWFLYVLFGIFVFYPVVYNLYKDKKYILPISMIVLWLACSHVIVIKEFRLDSVFYHLVYFNSGCLLKVFFDEAKRLKITRYQPILLFIPVLLAMCFAAWMDAYRGLGSEYKVVVAFMGIFFSWLLTRFQLFNCFFSRFGKYSLQLYLFNGFSLGASRMLICNVMDVAEPTLIILLNVLIDFFVMYIIVKYFFEKIKILRIMMGL